MNGDMKVIIPYCRILGGIACLFLVANVGAQTENEVSDTSIQALNPVSKLCDYNALTEFVRNRCVELNAEDGVLTDEEKNKCETGAIEFGSVGVTMADLARLNCALTLSGDDKFDVAPASYIGYAQTVEVREREKSEINELVASQVSSHDLTSEVFNPLRPAFQVNASSNSSSVQITAGKKFTSDMDDEGKLRSKFLTFKLSSPLNKKEDFTGIASLDGLANSTSLSFSWRNVISTGFRSSQVIKKTCNFSDITQIARNQCKFKAAADGILTDEELNACETGAVVFDSSTLSTAKLSEIGCSLLDADTPVTTTFYGLTFKLGYEEFKVLDTSTLESTTENEVPVSAGLHLGYVPGGGLHSILAGFDLQRAYEASENRTLCNPIEMSEQQECKTGAFSDPKRKDKQLLYLEYRRQFPKLELLDLPMAMNLRITHDFKSDVFGVDLPIYLLKDKEQQFTGGLRLSWRDDTDDLKFGVFVGSSFSIFSQE